jgi:hypothetical protein
MHLAAGGSAAVDGGEGAAFRHELAHPHGQLDHAVVAAGQFDQPGVVDAQYPARCPVAPRAPGGRQSQQRRAIRARRCCGGPAGRRRQPGRGDRRFGLARDSADYVHNLEQLHHAGHVAEEHRQADRHEYCRDLYRARRSGSIPAVAQHQRGNGVGERGQLRTERHSGNARSDERPDHPRGQLRARQLQRDQGQGEHYAEESQRRRADALKEAAAPARVGEGAA